MKIVLPNKVLMIILNLQMHGYDAYAVGGCVRDSILAKKPQDWDITTSAKPADIKRMFRRTVDTGIEHGTVTVLLGRESFEVTTYRIDGVYEDNRHPKEVRFTNNLEEDLKRRDFTINAMAYNDDVRLVDAFGGMKDLNYHLIRCVGNPKERFSEDALRILRAVRFSAQLGFSIEKSTEAAIKELAPSLRHVSAERIRTELLKILVSNHPEQLREAYRLGITKVILPEWDDMEGVAQNTPHHKYDVAEHTIHAIKNVKRDKILRLTMLFHDMGKPAMKSTDENGRDHFKGHAIVSEELTNVVMRRLKFDNETIKKVTRLVCYHDYRVEATPQNVRRAMNRIGVELFPYYLAVRLADVKAQSVYQKREKVENIIKMRELYQEALVQENCVTLHDLAVTGKDLMEIGMEPGQKLGSMLQELLEWVIDDPDCNKKEILCEYVKEKLGL
ncbi:MAG: HD domain-containing protein [Ruminococcus sp.]|uniref:HD domain-containing protein n=1 Tax=Schaedlerella arabinosiphila TaxID=2044587 RepID=N2APY2_9FIRM|nr:HD domain-containing protein [Schaedlerella arabinosiphila]MCI8723071.1 HD domain-containing protein [Ruminococcus sp.]KAI4440776.1 CCA-adding enzyme [Schaedlerella arabinosiphila]MCI9602717.1 HD domain-containing protein [Ruminococcus sp.]MCI9633838.1 HD domain-containing protein [Ruminococcus sp.]NDO69374.1 HD domain-containing protein [Schaedlerella arabinosiphila]